MLPGLGCGRRGLPRHRRRAAVVAVRRPAELRRDLAPTGGQRPRPAVGEGHPQHRRRPVGLGRAVDEPHRGELVLRHPAAARRGGRRRRAVAPHRWCRRSAPSSSSRAGSRSARRSSSTARRPASRARGRCSSSCPVLEQRAADPVRPRRGPRTRGPARARHRGGAPGRHPVCRSRRRRPGRRRRSRRCSCCSPSSPPRSSSTRGPRCRRSSATARGATGSTRAGRCSPRPAPWVADTRALEWQAEARWGFPVVAGYFVGPDSTTERGGQYGSTPTALTQWMADITESGQRRMPTAEPGRRVPRRPARRAGRRHRAARRPPRGAGPAHLADDGLRRARRTPGASTSGTCGR